MKKYQDGSPMRPTMKPSTKTGPGYKPAQGAPKVTITPKAKKGGSVKKYQNGGMTESPQDSIKSTGKTTKPFTPNKPMGTVGDAQKPMMKTGGMVNSNAKVTASKAAKGKVGGISKAPKTAIPKAKYGMSMRKK